MAEDKARTVYDITLLITMDIALKMLTEVKFRGRFLGAH